MGRKKREETEMGGKGLSSRAIIGMYYAALEQDPGVKWVGDLGMTIPSDQESEEYKWLGMAPAMREFIGGLHAKGLRENGITIKNKEFEATIEFLTRDMRRDKTGQITARINELAARTNAHWAKLLSALIVGGAAGICYDTLYFFDTTHDEGDSGSQSNQITIDVSDIATGVHGIYTDPSAGEMSHCILQAIAQIIGFVDDQGEPMNENARSFLVMTPISLLPAAQAAVSNLYLASGEMNTIVSSPEFSVKAVGNARLSSWTERFMVARTDGSVKPFILQTEVEPSMEALGEGSEYEIQNKKQLYTVFASRNVGYGYWQQTCQVIMTA